VILQPSAREVRRYGSRREKWRCGPPPPPFGVGTRLLGPDAVSIPPIPTANQTLWLKPSNFSAPSPSLWTDVSGVGNNFEGPGGVADPTAGTSINGKPTVNFNGTSQYLSGVAGVEQATITDPTGEFWTIFCVFLYTGTSAVSPPTGPPIIANAITGSWGCLAGESAGLIQAYGMNGFASDADFGTIISGLSAAPHIMAYRQNGIAGGSVLAFAVDGVAAATILPAAVANVSQPMTMGKDGFGNYFKGALGDIIAYNTYMTDAQVLGVFQNLGAEYGIAV